MEAMDHSEVRAILEDAAVEPGGLERLMAGDTPTASLVAGHLAGCPDCADELERLRRTVAVIAPSVRDVPPPELRERTLAFVAAVGRPRGAGATERGVAAPTPLPPVAVGPARPIPIDVPRTVAAGAPAALPVLTPIRRPNRLLGLTAVAAALVVAVTGTALITNARRDSELKLQAAEIEALGDVARWTLRVDQQPDVRRIVLASTTGSAAGGPAGELTFSPSSTELVVVANGLVPPPAGHEYKCWVESGGTRTTVGKMFFGGDVAYWVGPVPAIAGLPAGASFGVSLVDLSAPGTPGDAVLAGTG